MEFVIIFLIIVLIPLVYLTIKEENTKRKDQQKMLEEWRKKNEKEKDVEKD